MGWELIGGDPAPGSPDTVGTSSTALRRVADIARQARADLVAKTGAAGIQHWKGTAADAFRADVGRLPGDLDLISTSYREAASALDTFRGVLAGAQADARAALALANQAAADRDAAQQRHSSAQSEVDALTVQKFRAQASLVALQTQQKLSLDPAHRTSLNGPISSSTSHVNRLSGDLASARQSAARYQGQIDDANARLKQANERAYAIRQRLDQAVISAVNALRTAEKDAHLPSWWAQHEEQAKEWVETYGPAIINVLDDAQLILTIAALIPTPLSPVLEGAAIACGAVALMLSVAKDASDPGGITASDWMDITARTLGVVAGGVAVKAGLVARTSGVEAAKGWQLAARISGDGSDAFHIVKNAEDGGGGVRGFAFAAGTYLVGKGLSAGAIKGAQAAAAKANANPAVRQRITDMSARLRQNSDDPTNKTLVLSSEDARTTQSILGSGRIPPGGALPGNHGLQTINDHALTSTDALHRAEDTLDPSVSGLVDKVADRIAGHGGSTNASGDPAAGPDIDIDLNPSPYGVGAP